MLKELYNCEDGVGQPTVQAVDELLLVLIRDPPSERGVKSSSVLRDLNILKESGFSLEVDMNILGQDPDSAVSNIRIRIQYQCWGCYEFLFNIFKYSAYTSGAGYFGGFMKRIGVLCGTRFL